MYAQANPYKIFLRYTSRFTFIASETDISDERTFFVCDWKGISKRNVLTVFHFNRKRNLISDEVEFRIKTLKDNIQGYPNRKFRLKASESKRNGYKLIDPRFH